MDEHPQVINKLTCKILSFSTNKENLHALLKRLQERNDKARDIELNHLKSQKDNEIPPKTNEQQKNDDEKIEQALKEGFNLNTHIVSINGKELYGTIEDIFKSVNFPNNIKSIYINSENNLKISHNYYVQNSFELFLDFSKPDLFNNSLLPSFATPNESHITVKGFDPTWVNGLFYEFNNFIKDNPAKMTWLHRHSIYDYLVFLAGLPLGFFMVFLFSNFLSNFSITLSSFIHNALYVYIFFCALNLFKKLFDYARWVYPLVEYKSPQNKALRHRNILGTILIGLVTAFIVTVIKYMFKLIK